MLGFFAGIIQIFKQAVREFCNGNAQKGHGNRFNQKARRTRNPPERIRRKFSMVGTGSPKVKGYHNQDVTEYRDFKGKGSVEKQQTRDHGKRIGHVNANVFVRRKRCNNAPHTEHAKIPTHYERSSHALNKCREPQNHESDCCQNRQFAIVDFKQMNNISEID